MCQTTEPINTDRPDQSDGTYTLPRNAYQLETGLTYGKEGNHYLLHDIMLRYGLTSKTELRLLVDYGRVNSKTGIMPVGISFKRQIISAHSWIPDISAIGYVRLPMLGTNNFKPDKIPATLLLAFQNDISEKLSIGYNLGSSLDGESTRKNWILTASMGYSSSRIFSFFIEYFSQFTDSARPEHNIDIGAMWLLEDDLQLDIAIGSTIFDSDRNQFITTGISYKL